jgi:hypothetical protein
MADVSCKEAGRLCWIIGRLSDDNPCKTACDGVPCPFTAFVACIAMTKTSEESHVTESPIHHLADKSNLI